MDDSTLVTNIQWSINKGLNTRVLGMFYYMDVKTLGAARKLSKADVMNEPNSGIAVWRCVEAATGGEPVPCPAELLKAWARLSPANREALLRLLAQLKD